MCVCVCVYIQVGVFTGVVGNYKLIQILSAALFFMVVIPGVDVGTPGGGLEKKNRTLVPVNQVK